MHCKVHTWPTSVTLSVWVAAGFWIAHHRFFLIIGLQDIHADSYQLLVRSGREDGVFPLIGHENPYSIKMNHLREAVERLGEDTNVGRETFPIDGHFPVESLPDNLQCHFLLKHRSNDDCSSKQLKRKRALMKWRFRRSPTKLEELVLPVVSPSTPGALFGVSLPILCPDDNPPLPIMSMLHILHREGPHTNGLFRKSANVRACRNLRERLLAGMEISWSEEQLHVIATVFKDFLRNIPGSLLCLELYEQWLILGTLQDPEEAEEYAKWSESNAVQE
uniref:Rho-GAP domain-containing protein n=1 Tax=Eptatretus burgeri TaxID=7764 RepID=A0A8C4WZ09_EPTBU